MSIKPCLLMKFNKPYWFSNSVGWNGVFGIKLALIKHYYNDNIRVFAYTTGIVIPILPPGFNILKASYKALSLFSTNCNTKFEMYISN